MTVTGVIIQPEKDTVAVVTKEVRPGDQVICQKGGETVEINALEHIPPYHKISLKNMKAGEIVTKYGEGIGRLTKDVSKGGYINIHNLGLMEEKI